MGVDDAGDSADAAPHLLGNVEVLDPVVADGAHIDLGGEPKIQDLRRHVGGLEVEHVLRERCRQHPPQFADVVGARCVAVLERDHDHAVVDRDRRAIGEGPVIGARRHPEIVDDQIEVLLRNDLPDLVLDVLEDLLCYLDAGARRRAHVELDHAAIDRRIKITTDKDEYHGAERENESGDDRDDRPAGQQHREQPDIALAQMFEAALEGRVEARKEPVAWHARGAGVLTLQQLADRDRRQGAGQAVGSQHREDDRKAERREQVFCGAFEEDHRREDAADRQGRNQRRHRDFGGAV